MKALTQQRNGLRSEEDGRSDDGGGWAVAMRTQSLPSKPWLSGRTSCVIRGLERVKEGAEGVIGDGQFAVYFCPAKGAFS